MKLVSLFVIAGMAAAAAGPAIAGRDGTQIMQQERAAKLLQQERAKQKIAATQGLAGPIGPQGQIGPGTQAKRICKNYGHPSERVRC